MSATAEQLARGLIGSDVTAVTPVGRGGNSRVYRVDLADGQRRALKFYPSADNRDRLGQEYAALSFLERHGIADIPRPLSQDRAANCAVYSWVGGDPAKPPAGDADIDRFVSFLGALQSLRQANGAADLVSASASIFSPAAAIAQFEARFARLRPGAEDQLARFLDLEIRPTASEVIRDLESGYSRLGLKVSNDLAPQLLALSPSDFGLHNSLRQPDGTLAFVDFEYFGWDDPAKMLCDAGMHPGSELSASHRRRLFSGLLPLFSPEDQHFGARCRLLYPLLGLVWCLIILNEFLPERRIQDVSGRSAPVRQGQLEKARRYHGMLTKAGDEFAF